MPATPAILARLTADQAVQLVRQYGPDVLLDACADALTFYCADAQPTDPIGDYRAYQATADAIAAMRAAVRQLQQAQTETPRRLSVYERLTGRTFSLPGVPK